MSDMQSGPRWAETKKPILTMLGVWISFSFVVQLYITFLNKISVPVLGWPLGFYMAVQGSLIAFVVMLFWFARFKERVEQNGRGGTE